jgi:hypothetical protein
VVRIIWPALVAHSRHSGLAAEVGTQMPEGKSRTRWMEVSSTRHATIASGQAME